jgi:hypothetical protein
MYNNQFKGKNYKYQLKIRIYLRKIKVIALWYIKSISIHNIVKKFDIFCGYSNFFLFV